MPRRFRTGTALVFTAFVLAGCSLVESVIVVEPVRVKKQPAAERVTKLARAVPLTPVAEKCGQLKAGTRCSGGEEVSKAYSARYDSGPVLKPIKKSPEPKPVEPDSMLVKTVKNFFRTGMQLHNWVTKD